MRTRMRFAALTLALGMSAASVSAGVDIDFGAAVDIGDDNKLYLAISSHYFDKDRVEVERLGARYVDPDELAVALFIARHSGRSDREVYELRRRGLGWWDIAVKLGVPHDVWFVRAPRPAGPPYGKAHGYWKKHDRHHKHRVALGDEEVHELVAVRMMHDYFGVSLELAVDWRASGKNLRAIMSDEYGRRHGSKAAAQGPGRERGKPSSARGKGHAKHKGRDK